MSAQPKILLLGDYSNCHRSLAGGLRDLGCDVTQISDGTAWMNCDRQIDMSRKDGKLGGLHLLWRMACGDLRKYLKGYDVVSIHDPNFVRLKPKLLAWLFRSVFDIYEYRHRIFGHALYFRFSFTI